MNEYVQHELGDDEQDDKKIRRAEEGAEKAVKASASKRFKKLCVALRFSNFAFSRQPVLSSSQIQAGSSYFDRWRSYPSTSSCSTDGFPN